jgi:serine protease AprX
VHVLGELPPDSVLAQLHRDAQRPNGLWVGSGTSQATAVTSGLAAIWLAAHPGDGPLQVKAAIRSNTTALDSAAAGQGLVSTPRVRGDGNTGEDGFDEDAYWAAKWDVPGWMPDLGAMWSTGSWTATQWSANPWAGDGWSAASWAVKSWSVKSWSVKSWSTKSWSVKSWSAQSWGDSP